MKGTSITHQDIVKALLETKAVNFEVIGAAVAKYGPSLSVADEPWEVFCGTMRTFFHCYVVSGGLTQVEQLDQLRSIAGELKR